jgi:alpha-L-fucosidase 2
MKKKNLIIAAFTVLSSVGMAQSNLKLWYKSPAHFFEESLPIGNGRLGASIYGGINIDTLYLNDLTLWTGKPADNFQNKNAYQYLPLVREALFKEDYRAADSIQKNIQGHNSQYYQPLATIYITDNKSGNATEYYRDLNISDAISTVTYVRNGIKYKREYFASNPDKVIAIKLSADHPHAIDCEIALTSQLNHGIKAKNNQLTMTGYAKCDPENSIHFCSMLMAKNNDGEILATDSTLQLRNVTEATLYFVNETSFNGFDKNPVTEGRDEINATADDAWHLVNYSYDQIRERHLADYHQMFNKLTLSINNNQPDTIRTTVEQLKDYTDKKENNNYLESLYFQYGRYLLISSSRTSGVPANLQGLWNKNITPAWRGNYTMNINLEENYWPAEVANLGELVSPLYDFIKALSVTGRYTAQHFYNINQGWCASHNSDIWAMSNPVGECNESPSWSNWNMGGAWMVSTLWEHFAFGQDKRYLKDIAYPLMKGAADFCMAWLIDNPKNPDELITAPSTSPENIYLTDHGYRGCTVYGGTADMAIIRECLNNTLNAAKILNTDTDEQKKLTETIRRLRPYHIGKQGNIQEWYHDWADADPQHRHQSHLIGLYPGHQITVNKTPDLCKAATRTLEIKGDRTTGWSTGWRISLWARLHNNQKSYQLLRRLLNYVTPDEYNGADRRHEGGTYPNLFDAHPPFQIDGNFGGTAGICEMLVQSDINGEIELLPALPKEWKDGVIKGICARGGYTINITWKDNKVKNATIKSINGGNVIVYYNEKIKKMNFKPGQTKTIK